MNISELNSLGQVIRGAQKKCRLGKIWSRNFLVHVQSFNNQTVFKTEEYQDARQS